MKMLFITSSLIFSVSAMATSYTCLNQEGEKADLTIGKNAIKWEESWHAARSNAVFFGQEKAPYSERKGYNLFKLTSFYTTDDSSYILALNKMSGKTLKATVYFDNDDHEEEVTNYVCTLSHY